MQNDHVTWHESKKLYEDENNYASQDFDLETIIHALGCGQICSWERDLGYKLNIMRSQIFFDNHI